MKVPPDLELLLDSALQYPPALALARDEVHRVPEADQEKFLEAYAECLRRHLLECGKTDYYLARALGEQTGYMTAGEYYWIVGEDDRFGIRWVSRDYFVYTDPRQYFDLRDRCRVTHRPPPFRTN